MKLNPPNFIDPAAATALQHASHVVVFTGAGVSSESGIPTFRDALTGLWERFDAASLATPAAYRKDKDLVWGWYEWRRMQVLRALPNPAHIAIAALAQFVPKLTVVTQNVDDLHERAGSTNVVHLHGSLHTPRCFACGRPHHLDQEIPREPEGGRRLRPPNCDHCGGSIRPGVVWFGESLPTQELNSAFTAAKQCDVMLVVGTSGLVQPAAGLPARAKNAGASLIQINPVKTDLDGECTWTLYGQAGTLLPKLLNMAFPNMDLTRVA
ncbi:MAG: NAD-dependent deacylase [Rhodoferax ferrireducens]|uniref:NAD-dependent protein deacylase n=1 Tax=Rhodoferax ferrireducens TaxID=192843 RepID=A0A1W9KP51_9BURK|nr:MAG: NAD-dependent deacylase [Rhodoferax ferrireducens]